MPRGQNSVKGVKGGLTKDQLATLREQGVLPPPAPKAPKPPANVIPIRGPVTLGDALRAVAPSAPSGDASNNAAVPAVAPASTPTVPPAEEPGTDSFCQIAGGLTANVAVMVMASQIRRSKIEPEMPDDDDVDEAATATAAAFRRGLGDAPIPWWAGLLAAYGNLYIGMRTGGRALTDDEIAAARAKKQNAASSPPATPPAEPTAAGTLAATMTTSIPRPAPIAINVTAGS